MFATPISPAVVPELGSSVVIATLDPIACLALGLVAVMCVVVMWRGSHRSHPQPTWPFHPVRQPA